MCVLWFLLISQLGDQQLNIKSNQCCFYPLRKNQNESRDHDQVKEDLIPEGSDKLRMERAYVPKLNDELDSSPILFEDEVNKCKCTAKALCH